MSYVGNIRPYGSGKWGSHGKANANVPAEEMLPHYISGMCDMARSHIIVHVSMNTCQSRVLG
eukprot:5372-Amorphochlora_amoeboformis.AAC.2